MPIRLVIILIIPPIFPVPVLKPPFPEMIILIIIPNVVCITPKSNIFLRTYTFYIPSDKYSCPACSQMPELSMELESNSVGDSRRGNLGRGRGERGRARREGKGTDRRAVKCTACDVLGLWFLGLSWCDDGLFQSSTFGTHPVVKCEHIATRLQKTEYKKLSTSMVT
jgi:hypothetical protein